MKYSAIAHIFIYFIHLGVPENQIFGPAKGMTIIPDHSVFLLDAKPRVVPLYLVHHHQTGTTIVRCWMEKQWMPMKKNDYLGIGPVCCWEDLQMPLISIEYKTKIQHIVLSYWIAFHSAFKHPKYSYHVLLQNHTLVSIICFKYFICHNRYSKHKQNIYTICIFMMMSAMSRYLFKK